jgi:hypothetical protein
MARVGSQAMGTILLMLVVMVLGLVVGVGGVEVGTCIMRLLFLVSLERQCLL